MIKNFPRLGRQFALCLLAGFGCGVVRAQNPGNPDPSFAFDRVHYTIAKVAALAVLPDGKILVGGSVGTTDFQYGNLLRLFPDGTLDTSFDPNFNSPVSSVSLVADGKIVLGGDFRTRDGSTSYGAARLNPDGSIDSSFAVTAISFDSTFSGAKTAQALPDGKVLIGGQFNSVGGKTYRGVARLNADGSVDETFTPPIPRQNQFGDYETFEVHTIVRQADGKILIGGRLDNYPDDTPSSGLPRSGVERLTADGALDPTFAPFQYGGDAIAVQPDGKILVGGSFQFSRDGKDHRGLIRLNPDGSIDSPFTQQNSSVDGGGVNAIVVQPDGRILIGGSFDTVPTAEFAQRRQRVARLNADGTTDLQFDPLGVVSESTNGNYKSVFSLALQADGKVLIGGDFGQSSRAAYTGLARLFGGGAPVAPTPTPTPTPTPPPAAKAPDVSVSLVDVKVKAQGAKVKIKGSFQVLNVGGKPAKNTKVNFYISDDSLFDAAADTLLDTVRLADRGFPVLAKKRGTTGLLKLKIKTPVALVGSTAGRFLLAVVDPDDAIAENNESNNIANFGPLP